MLNSQQSKIHEMSNKINSLKLNYEFKRKIVYENCYVYLFI